MVENVSENNKFLTVYIPSFEMLDIHSDAYHGPWPCLNDTHAFLNFALRIDTSRDEKWYEH